MTILTGHITDHFCVEEFHCKDGTIYPVEWITERLKPLCQQLEKIRALTGQQMRIISGYRTKAYNDYIYEKLGRTPTNSMHIQGIAADILLDGMTILDLYRAIEKLIADKAIRDGGLGIYYTCVHYDIREKPARWNHTKWHTT
jgi:uncharacterized protein YcbK (DUF882 family)